MKKIIMYTDGACSGNPGVGGYGAVMIYGGHEREVSGFESETTNNRMELRAAIEGLNALKEPCTVELFTDSKYVQEGITTWVNTWLVNDWKNANRKPVKNSDLWQQLLDATSRHIVNWHWVRGHDGVELNERADRIARQAIKDGLQNSDAAKPVNINNG